MPEPDPVQTARERNTAKALAAKYTIVIVGGNPMVRYRGSSTAVDDATMIKWAVNLKASFISRYYPSRKGWLIFDVRRAMCVQLGGGFSRWVNAPRGTKVYPSMDAAMMVMIHKLD